MKIQHYSRLFKAETEEQYRARTIKRFQKLVDKRRAKGEHVVFDPDIVNNDMDRWFTQKAKGTPGIKPQLEAYKTHEELNEAMRNFKSKAEIENDLKTGDFEHEGKELVLSFGIYKVFKTRDVKALTLLAQNSNWCVRYPNAAENYLVGQGSTFYIVLRGTDRFVAIRETEENKPNVEVWWYTDYELRNGTNYAKFPADLIQEDLDAINQILQKLGFTKLAPGELFAVYPDIQTYLEHSRKKQEFKRFLYNQRFYPELANQLFTPGMTIHGDLDLKECQELTSLPENFTVLGDLSLEGCENLVSIPEGLNVEYSVYLDGCTKLTSLPKILSGRAISLKGCRSLKSLPEGLSAIARIDLANCSELTHLPKGLSTKILELENATSLTELPEDLSVEDILNLSGCVGLKSLPEGLKVKKHLNLFFTRLTTIPASISGVRNLTLRHCAELKYLPANLEVKEDLDLTGCRELETLPENLHVGLDLCVNGCKKITALPKGLEVGGGLYLRKTSITSLPEGLNVTRLTLEGTPITALPARLSVDEILNLQDLQNSIQSFPEDLFVGDQVQGRRNDTGESYQDMYNTMRAKVLEKRRKQE